MTTAEQKQALRRELLALRSQRNEAERAACSATIARHVIESDCFENARVILCYAPVRGEVDPRPIATAAWALGKTVAFVRSNPEDCTLTFCTLSSLDELTTGAYRIPEPPADAPILKNFDGALCVVPALAFDRRGFRLGYGKGYYDRFLADFEGSAIGLCYSRLLQDALPTDPHDRAVGAIFTEKGEELCR